MAKVLVSSLSSRVLVIDELHEMLYSSKPEQLENLSLLKGIASPPFNLSVILPGSKAAHNRSALP